MEYDKINEYVESIFNIFKIVKTKAQQNDDKKMKMISLLIYKYAIKMAKDHNVKIKNTPEIDSINLIPFFEYISHHNIELYDFSKIKIDDVDISKNSDLERFVLTHIYYITQTK